MSKFIVEVLRLGREFVDLRTVPKQAIDESEAMSSLQ